MAAGACETARCPGIRDENVIGNKDRFGRFLHECSTSSDVPDEALVRDPTQLLLL